MKISLNWLKDYIDIPCSPEELSEILTSLGLEVEGMERIESLPGGLKGVVVGEVKECWQHPNADRLSLTRVDVGNGEPLQIVCGAPNVTKGQKVLVATVGTMLHPYQGDPFEIKKSKIRGETSMGMICAEDEIGLSDRHDGIMVLPSDVTNGIPASEYLNIEIDYVYDIGLTPNRSDATSHLGVARDLAAYFTFHHKKAWKIRYPKNKSLDVSDIRDDIAVEVVDKVGCPRYSGISLSGLKISPSPSWIQNRLRSIDVRPINNVVDITNYVLHEFGQPLHAFDLKKISGRKIIVRNLVKGAKFITLDEQEKTLEEDDLMICDGLNQGMCIGGVYGGLNSGVTESTDRIFLESAHFNATRIRKTSTRHNLRTDAARCFEKGSDPSVTVEALQRAASLMVEYAGAKVTSDLVDVYPEPVKPLEVKVRRDRISKLIGNELSARNIEEILGALNMKFSESDGTYIIHVPTDKADVTREADVIEEILRIYGFNQVVTDNRISTSISVSERIDPAFIRNEITYFLSAKGYSEMMGLSFLSSGLYEKVLPSYTEKLVHIHNTSNVHLDAMRPEMMLPALQSVVYNHNRQQQVLRLFEFGTSYQREGEDFRETPFLIIVHSGNPSSGSWLGNEPADDFYDIKRTVEEVLTRLGLRKDRYIDLEDERFAYGLHHQLGRKDIVRYGLVSKPLTDFMELKNQVYFAEFSLETFIPVVRRQQVIVQEIPRYPGIRRDLAFEVDSGMEYAKLDGLIRRTAGSLLESVELFDVYQDDQLREQGKKSYAFSLYFVNPEKSLTDKAVDKVIKKIVTEAGRQLNAVLR